MFYFLILHFFKSRNPGQDNIYLNKIICLSKTDGVDVWMIVLNNLNILFAVTEQTFSQSLFVLIDLLYLIQTIGILQYFY